MHVVPETRSGKILFYKLRVGKWAEDPESIGLTSEAVAALQTLVDEAKQAYVEHSLAELAARSATLKYYQAVQRMHAGPGAGAGAALIQTIRAYAQQTGDPGVYPRARLRSPSRRRRPGSVPPPGTPTNFSVKLKTDGTLELRWACDNPDGAAGTTYEVRRRIGSPSGPFTFLRTVGKKRFVDDTLPAGPTSVEYQVTAVRSTRCGSPGNYIVNFGGAAGHVMVASFRPRNAA